MAPGKRTSLCHAGARIAESSRFGGAETGEEGTAILTGLTSGRKTMIGVDRATLDDPYLQPAKEGIVVVPRRGVASSIDIALKPTGEVEGTLYHRGEVSPATKLELVRPDGTVAARTATEYDGFFLFELVAYGSYELRLAESEEVRLGTGLLEAGSIVLDYDEQVANLGSVHTRNVHEVALAQTSFPDEGD